MPVGEYAPDGKDGLADAQWACSNYRQMLVPNGCEYLAGSEDRACNEGF
jgi:hypothetical protein